MANFIDIPNYEYTKNPFDIEDEPVEEVVDIAKFYLNILTDSLDEEAYDYLWGRHTPLNGVIEDVYRDAITVCYEPDDEVAESDLARDKEWIETEYGCRVTLIEVEYV